MSFRSLVKIHKYGMCSFSVKIGKRKRKKRHARVSNNDDLPAQESAADLSNQIKEAHRAKIVESKEKLSKVPWIQRLFGKKEINDD